MVLLVFICKNVFLSLSVCLIKQPLTVQFDTVIFSNILLYCASLILLQIYFRFNFLNVKHLFRELPYFLVFIWTFYISSTVRQRVLEHDTELLIMRNTAPWLYDWLPCDPHELAVLCGIGIATTVWMCLLSALTLTCSGKSDDTDWKHSLL